MGTAPTAYTGATFAVEKEDHTLANSLRFFLNKNPHVEFCGYSMPHPSEEVVNIRVQTTGEITAVDALRSACAECQRVCSHVGDVFQGAVQQYKQQQQQQEGGDVDMEDAAAMPAAAGGASTGSQPSKKKTARPA